MPDEGFSPRRQPLTRRLTFVRRHPLPQGEREATTRNEPTLPRSFDAPLPIDAVLDQLARTLQDHNAAVLVAPPGAGKTTRVPLALLDEPWTRNNKIIVLEPRRIAARASAERMARTLGERAGETVGYRVRFGSKVSRATRIEVVTEGIFSRQILDDPELSGVAAVLFDEFHERSLDADLGLALARDAQTGLREDLRILVMSATLDGARVAKLLGDAPVISSEGRAFPVETRYLDRKADAPLERQMAEAIAMALRADPGSVLAFLPGAAEIRRTQNFLAERVHDASVEIVPLFGALDASEQDRAIAPAPKGHRKVVLATSIAETSLTIEGVRIVVDCGLSRVPRYEPDIGLTRLETVRASRAAVDQRRGRAGRTESGVCYRLWDEPQTAAFAAYTQPEILSADLSSLVLDLAQWGVSDPASLAFLDPPPAPALKEARTLLRELGALDGDGRITAEGRRLRALALPPRLARMIVDSQALGVGHAAAEIAAVLTERGLGGDHVDLEVRLDQFRRDRSQRADSARALARRWASQVAAGESVSPETSAESAHRKTGPSAPSPLVGEGRGGGPTTAVGVRGTPPLTSPRKGEGKGTGPRKTAGRIKRRAVGSLRPASCWHWHSPTVSRATAAMAVLSLPTAEAPRSTRLPRCRARPISRLPNSPAPPRRDAFCWRRRSRRPRSNCISRVRSKPRTRSRSIAARWRCGRGAGKPCTRSRCRRCRWR